MILVHMVFLSFGAIKALVEFMTPVLFMNLRIYSLLGYSTSLLLISALRSFLENNKLTPNHLLVNDPVPWLVVRDRRHFIETWIFTILQGISLLTRDGLEHGLVALLVKH